jgi:hypothetical protein
VIVAVVVDAVRAPLNGSGADGRVVVVTVLSTTVEPCVAIAVCVTIADVADVVVVQILLARIGG